MRDRLITDLERIDITSATDAEQVTFVANSDHETVQVSMGNIVDMVKRSMGYLEKPLVKCRHCGQWGAVYCSCRFCGAPIDPV